MRNLAHRFRNALRCCAAIYLSLGVIEARSEVRFVKESVSMASLANGHCRILYGPDPVPGPTRFIVEDPEPVSGTAIVLCIIVGDPSPVMSTRMQYPTEAQGGTVVSPNHEDGD